MTTNEQPIATFFYRVDLVVPHPDYEGQDHQNDIALMKLSRKVDLDVNHIQPICIGSEDFYQKTIFDHLHHYAGWVAGWGSLREGGGSTAILQVGDRRTWSVDGWGSRRDEDEGSTTILWLGVGF